MVNNRYTNKSNMILMRRDTPQLVSSLLRAMPNLNRGTLVANGRRIKKHTAVELLQGIWS
jgi:hypothetical protein